MISTHDLRKVNEYVTLRLIQPFGVLVLALFARIEFSASKLPFFLFSFLLLIMTDENVVTEIEWKERVLLSNYAFRVVWFLRGVVSDGL